MERDMYVFSVYIYILNFWIVTRSEKIAIPKNDPFYLRGFKFVIKLDDTNTIH